MSDIVIREVTKDVWTFSRPFFLFSIVPVGGRSTAIKLRNGGVWLLASTPLSDETKAKLNELGPVEYIMAANAVHHLFIGHYKKEYPNAKLIAPKEAIARHGDPDLKFDGVWGEDPADTKYGFEDEIKACHFTGHKNKDVAFFHVASGTLIAADLYFNFPAKEQFSKVGKSGGFPLGETVFSWIHPGFVRRMGLDAGAMRRDSQTVAGWNFDRFIPCHGDVLETGAKKAWEDVYRPYLQ